MLKVVYVLKAILLTTLAAPLVAVSAILETLENELDVALRNATASKQRHSNQK